MKCVGFQYGIWCGNDHHEQPQVQKGLQVLACECEDESQKKIFKDHDKAEQPFYSPQGVQVISKFSDSQIKIDSCFW